MMNILKLCCAMHSTLIDHRFCSSSKTASYYDGSINVTMYTITVYDCNSDRILQYGQVLPEIMKVLSDIVHLNSTCTFNYISLKQLSVM